MAGSRSKSKSSTPGVDVGKNILTSPTWFGSHASMVVAEWTEKVNDPEFVVLKDNDGFYATEKKRLDNKLADSYRYTSSEFRAKLLTKLLPDATVVAKDEVVSLS